MTNPTNAESCAHTRGLPPTIFIAARTWVVWALWLLICLLALCNSTSHAQGKPDTYSWLARTSEVTPVPSAGWGDFWQVRDGLLQQVSLREGVLETNVLRQGGWDCLSTARVSLPGSQYPQLVQNQGTGGTYIWSYKGDTMHVARVHQDGTSKLLFSVQSDPVIRLLTSQGSAKVFGDADVGFWVTNGGTMYIEPGTWKVREVPGLSTGRQHAQSSATQTPAAIAAAALGRGGALWTLESTSGDVVKRDASGKVLVRVASPFGKAEKTPLGVTTYGAGNLAPSLAGVMVLSSTRLALASLGDDGAVLWRASVCPQGEVSGCADEARQRGRVQRIGAVAGDAQGNAYVGDGVRIFHMRSATDAAMLLGSAPPCVPSQAADTLGGKRMVACVNASDRLVSWGPGNHVIYTIAGGLAVTYKVVIEPGPPANVHFEPITTDLADLPLALRQAILTSVLDLRVWQHTPEVQQANYAEVSPALGIPARHGIVESKEMMSKDLSVPDGGALRTPQDVLLSQLFGNRDFQSPTGYSAGRLGADGVVIKDWRVGQTRLASFDAQIKVLTQNIALKGLPERPHQTLTQSYSEYLFNDQHDGLYLFQGWSGQVHSIDRRFSATLVARLPPSASPPMQQLAAGATGAVHWPVRSAIKTPAGRLVLATPAGVFAQTGNVFAMVSAPQAVLQLVALNELEVLAVAAGGVAKLSLPR